jgi:hypothetical protein
MPDPRSSLASDEPPRSSAPTVTSAASSPSSLPPETKFPLVISAIGLFGVVAYTLLRLTLPPEDAAIECLQAALPEKRLDDADSSLDVAIVLGGKLEVGGHRAMDIAKGPLADPIRRKAIEHCRAVYAKQAGLSASSPLLQVETAAARVGVRRSVERDNSGKLEKLQQPVEGARVSVEGLPGHAPCITSSSGDCEIVLHHLAHDAKLDIAAKLHGGIVASKSISVLELLRHGLLLDAHERAPAIHPSTPAPDCRAAGLEVDDGAQFTKVPADAAGHQLEALVEVMSSGIVADIQPVAGADPKALAALRSQLATLRGLPGPCSKLRVSLHY